MSRYQLQLINGCGALTSIHAQPEGPQPKEPTN